MKNIREINMSLPAIQKEISTLLDSIYQSNPEIRDDDDFKLDILEGSTDFIEIIDTCIFNISITEGFIDGIKRAREKLDYREERLKARANTIRQIIKKLMEIADVRTVKAPSGTATIAAKPRSVEIVDEGLIPDKFMRITKSPSKTLIGTALKAGEDVPGTQLSNGGETLTIR